jgi:prepilin-type N-terminal cleavage/methylation domain-containing protein
LLASGSWNKMEEMHKMIAPDHLMARLCRPKCGGAGFTLIELMVVLAVIAIVAGALLPGLSKARVKAQGIICIDNNKQMCLAWRLYSEDKGDKIPGARGWDVAAGLRQPDWTAGNSLSLVDPSAESNWNVEKYNKKSVLWPYCGGALGIWKCPGDRSTGINNKNQKGTNTKCG